MHDERNISSHSSHRRTPVFLIWEGRLTQIFILFLWKRQKSSAWSEGIFSSQYAVPWEDPKFPQFCDCNLLSSDFRFSGEKKKKKKKKVKALHDEVTQLVISWETSNSFGSGKNTHPRAQFVSLERKEKSTT